MKTITLLLRKTAKSVLIAALMCVAGMTKVVKAQPLIEWELEQPYLFYLVYDDVQARSSTMVTGGNPIRDEQLPHIMQGIGCWHHDPSSEANDPNCPCEVTQGWLCLAKNEMEGFQVFYREQDISRNLRVEVSDFVNVATSDTLPHTLYYEEFFYAVPYGEGANAFSSPDSLAEALVPYFGEVKVTQPGFNKMFYVELHSRKDQSPGNYISIVTLFDGNDTLDSKPVTARVWDFVLPENHYAEVVMGLYNRNSGYNSTSTFLTLNGIQVDDNGNVAPEDLEEAKRILNGYQNCLIEHGVSTYEIPRWLMEDDPKKAELTMADPRRKMFMVPVLYDDLQYPARTDFTLEAKQVLQQYKDVVYDNPFLKDKAFFSPYNEPKDATDFGNIDQFCSVLSDYWPGYHATVPFYSNYDSTIENFEGKIDILCPIRGFFNPGVDFTNAPIAEERLQDYMTRPHKWWYPDNAKTGGVDFFVYNTASVGIMRRILFWQQYMVHGQGLLYWNCAFLPQDWQKKQLPPEWAGGMVHGNGDGILLYPGTMFGQDAATPVVSLRLKQLAAGIDDYDYLCLAKEFLGETMVNARLSSIFYRRGRYANYLCSIMSKEYVNEQGIGEEVFISYSCHQMQIDRAWYMGQQLSQANTEHNWGEWQIAVLPDETHDDGLEIRCCQDCGTQESRPMPYSSLYRFVGTEDNQWANLNNWANNPETLPSPDEAVVIAHDCEINDNTTVYYVFVDDEVNLTINEGATLTSERITTEGNAQVIIEDGAQLYTMSEGVQATVKKSIATHGDTDGWYLISTSLASDVVPSTSNNIVSSTASNYDLYWFDQNENHEWRNHKANEFNLENGKGYLYANSEENVSLEFTGTTNGNTQKSFGLTYDANANFAGWNLVGNPYPCNVYADKSYYTLDENGSVIEPNTVSSSTAIAPCAGIMVKADSEGESVTFSKTAPETQGRNNGMLQILVAENTLNRDGTSQNPTTVDKVIVSFNEGDRLEKYTFNTDNARIYVPQGEKEYSIAFAEKRGEMPLNFLATKDGTYTITVNPEAVKLEYLHLIDNMTGDDIDLLVMPSYTFTAKATDYASRFRLVFVSGIK